MKIKCTQNQNQMFVCVGENILLTSDCDENDINPQFFIKTY